MRAMMADTDLSNGARLAAARLALHLNVSSGECDPAYATLAKEVGMRRRGVIPAIAYMIERGWLGETNGGKRHVNQFGKQSNNFTLRWPDQVVTGESPHGDRG